MIKQTTVEQRREFYQRHQAGETYEQIGTALGVSKECVRYWCRRQRDGGPVETSHQRSARGLLSRFDPKVRYALLRLRLEHPRWGPRSLRHALRKRASLRGLRLPQAAQIGRYLHQWPRFRRPPKGVSELIKWGSVLTPSCQLASVTPKCSSMASERRKPGVSARAVIRWGRSSSAIA